MKHLRYNIFSVRLPGQKSELSEETCACTCKNIQTPHRRALPRFEARTLAMRLHVCEDSQSPRSS